MGKIVNYGEKWDKREKEKTSREFLRNVAQNGLYGDRNPEKCHHPIRLTFPAFKIGNTQYYESVCRDCGKTFEIFKR